MSELTQNVPLNIYEPEISLKIYKNPKKKSIITKIIKNPEIAPANKKISFYVHMKVLLTKIKG